MLQAIEVHGDLTVRVNLLRTKLDRTPPANVFLLDAKGKILWQIAEFIFAHSPQFYSNIWLDDSGNLMAGVPKGYDCHIDIKTGKILSSKFTK